VLGWIVFFFMPEPVAERKRLRLRIERPSVPPVVRRQFVLAALAAIASWSIGGLFLSLGPELTSTILSNDNVLVSSLPIIILGAVGALSQVLFGRMPAWKAASRGSVALTAGILAI